MILALLLVALPAATPAAAQIPMPQLLARPGEANALPEAVRIKMVEAERKIQEARGKFWKWNCSTPHSENATAIQIRWNEFSDARAEAIEAIGITANEEQKLSSYGQKVLFHWTKRAIKQLSCHDLGNRRTHRVRFFSLSKNQKGG
jgi:hypothetical protein